MSISKSTATCRRVEYVINALITEDYNYKPNQRDYRFSKSNTDKYYKALVAAAQLCFCADCKKELERVNCKAKSAYFDFLKERREFKTKTDEQLQELVDSRYKDCSYSNETLRESMKECNCHDCEQAINMCQFFVKQSKDQTMTMGKITSKDTGVSGVACLADKTAECGCTPYDN